jgi:hypothetical protein
MQNGLPRRQFDKSKAALKQDIIRGVRAMRMDAVPGYAPLGTGEFVIARVLNVESDWSDPYYLVEILGPDGQPLVNVVLSLKGLIRTVGDMRTGHPVSIPDLSSVEPDLGRRFAATRLRYFYGLGNANGASSVFLPVIAADSPSGTLIVNFKGEVFEYLSFPSSETAEQRLEYVKSHRDALWLEHKQGIVLLHKLGDITLTKDK